jgi:hypothetical protein
VEVLLHERIGDARVVVGVPTAVSGHVFRREGKLRAVWVAKWRDAAGQHKKVLGRDWTDKGAPPAGYLRRKDAEAMLQALLTDARRGTVEQLRTGLTFDLAAEQWLAWGLRDRDWKPSTLSDNRSVLNAHLRERGSADLAARLQAWDETERDLANARPDEFGIRVDTDRSSPADAARAIDAQLRRMHALGVSAARP